MTNQSTTSKLSEFTTDELLHIHFCLHLKVDEIAVRGEVFDVEHADSRSQLFNRISGVEGLTFITQNMRKTDSFNTVAVARHAEQGNTLMLTWVSHGFGPFIGLISSLTQKGAKRTDWEILNYEIHEKRNGNIATPKRNDLIHGLTVEDMMKAKKLVLIGANVKNPRAQHLPAHPDAPVKMRKKDQRTNIRTEILCTGDEGKLIEPTTEAPPMCKRCLQAAGLTKTGDTEWHTSTSQQRSA